MQDFSVRLATPAHDMAREEILKQAAFLGNDVEGIHFSANGSEIFFRAPAEQGPGLAASLETLAKTVQRTLRSLQRKVLFRSPGMDDPHFAAQREMPDVRFLGTGQAALAGAPLALFRYFDRVFEEFGARWNPRPLVTPTLIPSRVLAKCDYFRSFPQYVTFAAHLKEDVGVIDRFRSRHQTIDDLDENALGDLQRPEACLSPAVCYHVYHLYEGQTIPSSGVVHGVCGKCFRYEAKNLLDLRRLWDFTLREIVFLGERDQVLEQRNQSIEMMGKFLSEHRLTGEIRTASDPFFVAPDAASKTYFQLSSDAKFEVSLALPAGERLAVGSHNYHSDFFGRVFQVNLENGGPMHSMCVGWGLERWVYAFIQQHGNDPAQWPDVVRRSPEIARCSDAAVV